MILLHVAAMPVSCGAERCLILVLYNLDVEVFRG